MLGKILSPNHHYHDKTIYLDLQADSLAQLSKSILFPVQSYHQRARARAQLKDLSALVERREASLTVHSALSSASLCWSVYLQAARSSNRWLARTFGLNKLLTLANMLWAARLLFILCKTRETRNSQFVPTELTQVGGRKHQHAIEDRVARQSIS